MNSEKVDGFIKELIPTPSTNLNFVKIIPIQGIFPEINIPFYGEIGKECIGKFVTITSKIINLEGLTLEQKAEGVDWKIGISLPYSNVEQLRKDYLDYFFQLDV
jgi:hypothetical protein